MIFSSFRFMVFLPVVLALYYACRSVRMRNFVLLAASYFFYGSWDPRFVWLLLGSTVLGYVTGAMIDRSTALWQRRAWLALSVAGNIGVLLYFKYADFFITSFHDLLGAFGVQAGFPLLNLVLPLGISFYSFESLSYSLDIYNRRLKPTRDFLDFALFVSFFVHLVAGPIVRASELLPQLQRGASARREDVVAGLNRFAEGFTKKVLVADSLSPYVDRIFANPSAHDGLTLWCASLGFAVQCYCDFAGYTDMAIGCARLLGFKLPENFRWPFLASNIADFWKRWHITLYSFMRDYVYYPLCRKRVSMARQMAYAVLTMTLIGLWHGAAWHYVLWGLYNGLLVVGYRFLSQALQRTPPLRAALGTLPGRILGIATTDLLFVLSCTLFRSTGGLAEALDACARMLTLAGGRSDLSVWPLLAFAAVILGSIACEQKWGQRLLERVRQGPLAVPLPVAGYALLIVVLVLFSPRNTQAFIYFQF